MLDLLTPLNPVEPSLPSDLWFGTSGPRNAKIAIVGEAWGEMESIKKQPFVGQSGDELTRMLAEAGIRRDECFITNCVPARPPQNDITEFFHGKPTKNNKHSHPPFRGAYPNSLLKEGLDRLYSQLTTVRPTVILAFGNTAFWALSREARVESGSPTGISDFRGSMLLTDADLLCAGIKLIPTLHPAAILKAWYNRPVVVHDLKTRVKLALANDWSPRIPPHIRHLPSFDEARSFLESKLHMLDSGREVWLSCDIETRHHIITCLGFGESARDALVIPFVKKAPVGFESYWLPKQEVELTKLIRRLLPHPRVRLIGQNFMYDMTYLHRFYGVTPRLAWDTMGFQHLLFPGTQKDLGYLSSIYCHYHRFWKDDNKEWDAKSDMNDHLRYNGEDCLRTFEIAMTQRSLLDARLTALWSEELEKHEMAFEMATRGVCIDQSRKAHLSLELSAASQYRIAWLLKIIPQKLIDERIGPQKVSWPTSAAQQKLIFYDILMLNPQRHRKTGAITLDKEALPKLKKQAPWLTRVIDTLLELRSINVFASTFLGAGVDLDGRMRTSFNAFGTETFRWSSSANPFGGGCNFQNLPKGNEE